MYKETIIGEVTEIASDESNDIYMSLHIRLITDKKNLNGLKFTKSFINSIVDNRDFYNGLPLVAEKQKLEKKEYSSLGHAKNTDDSFHTDQIGSFITFYSKENKSKNRTELFGVAKVFKRFPQVCESIMELYEQDKLFFSVEASVGQYESKNEFERVVSAHEDNCLLGDCLVSYPAEKASVAEILVAENEEGENMKNKKTEKDFFEKTIFCESAELDLSQVRSKVYDQCMKKFEDSMYDYFCSEFGYDYMILRNYDTAELYKVDYSVKNDEVEISEMYKVKRTYVAASVEGSTEENSEGSTEENSENSTEENSEGSTEENSESSEGSTEENSETENNSDQVETNEVDTLKKTVFEKDVEILELKKNLTSLSEKIIEKDNEISELKKVQDEFNTLKTEISEKEKEISQEKLKEKYSKLLTKEVMESEDVIKAIDELNSEFLKDLVVNNALESVKDEKPETLTNAINDPIEINGSDVVSKYITRN